MAELNIASATTPTKVSDYRVPQVQPDSPRDQEETFYDNPNFTRWFSNYKGVAKIKKAIDGYATWILGQGYMTLIPRDSIQLRLITGWGEDTFNQVLWNMLVTKKVGGDAYAEIITDNGKSVKDGGTMVNLKPLNPQFMRHVCNRKGRIKKYIYRSGSNEPQTFNPEEIFHLCNNRVVDEIHGVSDIEAVEWNVEATEEAKRAHRKMVKNNGVVRVIEVDMDDTVKMNGLKNQWKTAIENGDVLLLPKDTARASDWHGQLDTVGVVQWLKHLDDDFYMSIGVPRVILGGAENSIEASSKIGFLSFEQIYDREQTELEADIRSQLRIELKFNKPQSLMDTTQSDQAANTGQVGFQPNDVKAGSGAA
jgi:hypothetical protein